MPSSTSTNASSRASSSSNIARKSTKPSRAMSQVIEIDDSSDDGQDASLPLFRPPTRPSTSLFTGAGRSAPWPSTGNSSTSTAAGSNQARRPLAVPQRDAHSANRRVVAPMTDSSATEHTSDSGAEQQRQANGRRHTRACDSAPDRPVRSRDEGASASISRAPAASTSRDKVTITSNNTRPRTASLSNRPNPKDKANCRGASTSATEDSSADEAPVVATSSATRPRPVGTEIVNMTRGQAAAAADRTGPSASRRDSVTSLSRASTAGDTSSKWSIRDQQRQKPRGKIRRRPLEDVETSESSDDSDSDDESTTDSTAVTVASSAQTAMIRPTRTMARKRALEPEVTVTTTKRSKLSNTTADTSAGPSNISTRTRGAGSSKTGSTASVKDADSKADAKGKGRAPRSSIEPASVTKATSSIRAYNSGVPMPSFLDNALFPQGKNETLVSPSADIYSESTKVDYPNVSKVITKVVIKPTDLSEELECAICSDIMVSPVNLICGHTFCEACVTPWLDTNKDCPSCRTKMDTAPVRSYLADRVIKKYLETIYTSLEAEGKLKEAKAARAERATAEKDAEKRRMKAAADKNRRAAAEARLAAARGQAGYGLALPARANRPPGGMGLQEWIAQMQNHHGIGGAGAGAAPGNAAGAAAVPPPAPPANARQAARRGARAVQAAAAQAAAAQAAAQGNAGAGHVLGGGGAAAGGAAQNNAAQFGGLLQNRNGALHVDPARLQQTADEMGVPAAQLFQMMFQG